jgi:hypothetical protein
MKPIPATPQMLGVVPRIIWFEPPERALADPVRFMAYAMTYARHEDMRPIREYVSDEDFREALDRAPPGIIDPRSWAYWNSKMGRYPPPPLPNGILELTRHQHQCQAAQVKVLVQIQHRAMISRRHGERVAKRGSKCLSNNLTRTWRKLEGVHARTGSRGTGLKRSNNHFRWIAIRGKNRSQ